MKYSVDLRGTYLAILPPEEVACFSYLGKECISAYWQRGKGADWMYVPVSLAFLQIIVSRDI